MLLPPNPEPHQNSSARDRSSRRVHYSIVEVCNGMATQTHPAGWALTYTLLVYYNILSQNDGARRLDRDHTAHGACVAYHSDRPLWTDQWTMQYSPIENDV